MNDKLFLRGDLVSWPYPSKEQLAELGEKGEPVRTYGVVSGWRGDIDAYEVMVDVGSWWVTAEKLTLLWRPNGAR